MNIEKARAALMAFVSTIENTGGLSRDEEDRPVAAGDPEWLDLADAAFQAKEALAEPDSPSPTAELLAACKAAKEWAAMMGGWDAPCWAQIDAAIAKAESERPPANADPSNPALEALKNLQARWNFLSDPEDETEINGADFLDDVTGWWRDLAMPAMEGR